LVIGKLGVELLMEEKGVQKILNCIESLKRLVRSGWMMRGVPASIGESVASHSFEASLLSLLLSDYLKNRGITVSPERTAVLALIHDVPECMVGDIPLKTSISIGGLKEELELRKAEEIFGDKWILQLFIEYLEQKTLESKIARISEKLSTIVESKRMISLGYVRVDEILESTRNEIENIMSSLDRDIRVQLEEYVRKIIDGE
jgi:putative hydrolase of HD superfamily